MAANCTQSSGAVLTQSSPPSPTGAPPVAPEDAAREFERAEEAADSQLLPVVFVASQVSFPADAEALAAGRCGPKFQFGRTPES